MDHNGARPAKVNKHGVSGLGGRRRRGEMKRGIMKERNNNRRRGNLGKVVRILTPTKDRERERAEIPMTVFLTQTIKKGLRSR